MSTLGLKLTMVVLSKMGLFLAMSNLLDDRYGECSMNDANSSLVCNKDMINTGF